jgi:hypothetical protein
VRVHHQFHSTDGTKNGGQIGRQGHHGRRRQLVVRRTVVLSTIIVFMTAREVWRYVHLCGSSDRSKFPLYPESLRPVFELLAVVSQCASVVLAAFLLKTSGIPTTWRLFPLPLNRLHRCRPWLRKLSSP